MIIKLLCYAVIIVPLISYVIKGYEYGTYNKSRLRVDYSKTVKVDKRNDIQKEYVFLTLEREDRVVIPKFPQFIGSATACSMAASYILDYHSIPMVRNQPEHISEERGSGWWFGDVPFGW